MGVLEGIRVLDVSTMLAGPFGSMMLADLGAEVVKIETPDGDGTRKFPPHFHKGMSMYYMAFNRNKKSMVIDLKSEGGLKVFHDLVKHADVVWDNYRPGITEKLKINYEVLKEINPKIICSSVTAYGSNNPYGGNKPSYDLCIQGQSGVLSLTGEPGRSPVKLGIPMADISGGWYAVVGVLAALLERQRTNKGQKIDIAMLDSIFSLHCYEAVYCMHSGIVPQPIGTAHRSLVPYQIFPTKDIYIAIVVALDKFWVALCKALDLPECITDERYRTIEARYNHREEVVNMLENIFIQRTANEWLPKLEKEGVPCAPVNPLDKAIEDPALLYRNMIVKVNHEGEEIRLIGNPIKLSNNTDKYNCPPKLGQDTESILRTLLHYTPEQIKKLEESKAVASM